MNTRMLYRLSQFVVMVALCPIVAWAGPLDPFTEINMQGGFAVGSGAVSSGHEVFRVALNSGTNIIATVLVEDVLPGSEYTSDDTKLFLFDPSGNLLSENNDPPPEDTFFQSLLPEVRIDQDGDYFFVVTTFDNKPVMSQNNAILDWLDDGGGSVAFQIEVIDTAAFTFGDFNADDNLDAADIDLLFGRLQKPGYDLAFDVNGDGFLDDKDIDDWVHLLRATWFGDANLDGTFDSADLVEVFKANEYEDGILNNSGWSDGDWNADGEFDSGDLVAAFKDGGYEVGIRNRLVAVSEPSSFSILGLFFVLPALMRNDDRS